VIILTDCDNIPDLLEAEKSDTKEAEESEKSDAKEAGVKYLCVIDGVPRHVRECCAGGLGDAGLVFPVPGSELCLLQLPPATPPPHKYPS